MKAKLVPALFLGLAATVACSDDTNLVSADAPSAAAARAAAAQGTGPHLAGLAAQAHANGGSGAAFFEDVAGLSFLFFDPFPAFCGIGPLDTGTGSFYRQNPDGSVTAKLSGRDAPIGYSPNLFAGPSYSGTGQVQVHSTGAATVIPLPTGTLIFLGPPFRGETVWHARGTVVEDGTGGPAHELSCTLHLNPDGSTKRSEISFG